MILATGAGLTAMIPRAVTPLRVWGTEVEARLAADAVAMAGVPQTGATLRVELHRDDPDLALSGSAVAELGKGILAGPAGTAANGEQAVLTFFVAGRCVTTTAAASGRVLVTTRPANGPCTA
jgi:hypothetical protein